MSQINRFYIFCFLMLSCNLTLIGQLIPEDEAFVRNTFFANYSPWSSEQIKIYKEMCKVPNNYKNVISSLLNESIQTKDLYLLQYTLSFINGGLNSNGVFDDRIAILLSEIESTFPVSSDSPLKVRQRRRDVLWLAISALENHYNQHSVEFVLKKLDTATHLDMGPLMYYIIKSCNSRLPELTKLDIILREKKYYGDEKIRDSYYELLKKCNAVFIPKNN